jgi:Protein of unknown function (DUF3995)
MWAGYGAAIWALIFAALHVAWAAGWYVGLEAEKAREAFQKPWFLAYDLVVAGLCAVAVFVALAVVQPWGRRMPRRLVIILGWMAAGLLLLRGGAGVVQFVSRLLGGKPVWHPSALWELWFCVGAVLFTLSAWRFTRFPRRGDS